MSKVVGDFPLKDKIVVITGAGSGINLAFARLAHSKGARVLIADITLTKDAEEFLETVKNDSLAPVVFQRCDVTVWKDLENIITGSQEHFGDVPDVYVPGAGVFEPTFSNFWDDPESDSYASVAINVSHPIKLTRLAIRALLGKNKQGVVLLVASVGGLSGYYSLPLYAATKHAIKGFGQSMAHADMLEGVKVVTICPGIVKTPIWTDRPDKMEQFAIDDQRCLFPDDVAATMAELVESSKYPGGTVVELTLSGQRVIPLWNVDPPQEEEIPPEFGQINYAPIIARCAKERVAG